jgi:hypothetical protein
MLICGDHLGNPQGNFVVVVRGVMLGMGVMVGVGVMVAVGLIMEFLVYILSTI